MMRSLVGWRVQTRLSIDRGAWQIVRLDGSPMPSAEYASVRALSEQRLIESVEMGVCMPSGGITWMNVTAAPLPLDGYGVVATYGDISARNVHTDALRGGTVL